MRFRYLIQKVFFLKNNFQSNDEVKGTKFAFSIS